MKIRNLIMTSIAMISLLVSGCSCARVDIKVEGGKVVESDKKIRKGDTVKLECDNPHNFGYWYIEEDKPLSYYCNASFTVESDVTFKVASVAHFVTIAFKGEEIPSDFETVIDYFPDILSDFNKNSDIADYALYSFDGTQRGNLTDKGITKGSGTFEGLYIQNYDLSLYVPNGGVYATFKGVWADGKYKLINCSFLTSDSGSVAFKENDTSALKVNITVTHKASDSYKG